MKAALYCLISGVEIWGGGGGLGELGGAWLPWFLHRCILYNLCSHVFSPEIQHSAWITVVWFISMLHFGRDFYSCL